MNAAIYRVRYSFHSLRNRLILLCKRIFAIKTLIFYISSARSTIYLFRNHIQKSTPYVFILELSVHSVIPYIILEPSMNSVIPEITKTDAFEVNKILTLFLKRTEIYFARNFAWKS